ncbi:E3 ubiquitin-protein ligase [Nymphaea thermarum]|nr:E3 ubiquitin-protein ligase [Nymphaea thermarum]
MRLKLHNVPSSKRSDSVLKSTLSSVRLEGDPEIRSLLSGFERLIQQVVFLSRFLVPYNDPVHGSLPPPSITSRLDNSDNIVLFVSEMKEILASIEQVTCRGSSRPASWYRSLYAEIEEVGWENLSSFGEALTSLNFSIMDTNGKTHKLNMSLGKDYPHCAPSIVAHIEKFQEFWSILDDIDVTLCVLEPRPSSRAATYRHVGLGNDCTLLVSIDPYNARSLPQRSDVSFRENLECILGIRLPVAPSAMDNHPQIDCGICYACYLPEDGKLGVERGSMPGYVCDNERCGRAFHVICLRDWLQSITTTRKLFDALYGNCPYCSEPVAVKI